MKKQLGVVSFAVIAVLVFLGSIAVGEQAKAAKAKAADSGERAQVVAAAE